MASRRWGGIVLLLALLVPSCGDDDAGTEPSSGTTTAVDPTATTGSLPESTTTPAPGSTVVEPTETTQAASTTALEFEPAATITLDDGQLGMEPPGISYRVQLTFSMRAELSDGAVQEGSLLVDGGKLVDPDELHSLIVDVEGLVTIPDCYDIAASPRYVNAYDTFYGGVDDEDPNDLTGEAMLSEVGVMTNGVLIDRYEITLDNVNPEVEGNYVSFTEAYADIAREGGQLVRLVLNGLGFNNTFTVDQSEPREIVYQLDFSEFGEITELTAPEGCQS